MNKKMATKQKPMALLHAQKQKTLEKVHKPFWKKGKQTLRVLNITQYALPKWEVFAVSKLQRTF